MKKKKSESKKLNSDPHIETFDEKKERYETPFLDYNWMMDLVKHLGLPIADIDIMASRQNTKCKYFLGVKYNSIINDFLIKGSIIPKSIFLNAPHKLYNKMVPQCDKQYNKYGFTIIALIPSRNERTNYWHDIIEPNRFECVKNGYIFYIPLKKKFIFEIDGEQAHSKKCEIQHDPNGYKLVLWIGRKYLKDFKKNLRKFYHWYYVELPKQEKHEKALKKAQKEGKK